MLHKQVQQKLQKARDVITITPKNQVSTKTHQKPIFPIGQVINVSTQMKFEEVSYFQFSKNFYHKNPIEMWKVKQSDTLQEENMH